MTDDIVTNRIQNLIIKDLLFRWSTRFFALLHPLMFAGTLGVLIQGSWEAIQTNGFEFFIRSTWNPVTGIFGGVAPIVGTCITTCLAMAVAAPLGRWVAAFQTEICPRGLRPYVGTAIDALAAVPSIVYGTIALLTFVPYMQMHIEPALGAFFEKIPGLSYLFSGAPYGHDLLTASAVLGFMTIPSIASFSREAQALVPAELKKAAKILGYTTAEITKKIVFPYTRKARINAMMLGLGRAFGETMMVAMVIGNSSHLPTSLLSPATSITAIIANEFAEAITSLHTSSLLELGLVLTTISLGTNLIKAVVISRVKQNLGSPPKNRLRQFLIRPLQKLLEFSPRPNPKHGPRPESNTIGQSIKTATATTLPISEAPSPDTEHQVNAIPVSNNRESISLRNAASELVKRLFHTDTVHNLFIRPNRPLRQIFRRVGLH